MSYVAMDCEMVGGLDGQSMAARVSLVNEQGTVLLDEYIQPQSRVSDYRTSVSGITPAKLNAALSLSTVKSRVAEIIHGGYLVGHSLEHDLKALELKHPESMRRDLAHHERFRRMNGGQPASLKFLARELLRKNIQDGQHSSVEDAKISMEIFLHHWD